jgi:uncharacterized SAM-binding protein YcdF (DUF218 family)
MGVALVSLADLLGLTYVTGWSPWALRLVGGAGGALLAPSRVGAWLWPLAGLLVALLLLVTGTPLVRGPVQWLVRDDAEQPVDAVAVLSGSVTDDGRLTGTAIDRLLTGLAEAKRRRVPMLLSEVRSEPGPAGTGSEADQRALARLADPALRVHVVRDVHSTRDEAVAFAAMARANGWRRVLLVTSPTHTRRACAAVEHAGLAVECRPSDARDYSVSSLRRAEARRLAFQDLVYEAAALALYRVRGWITRL